MSPEIEEKIRSAAEQKGVDPELAVKIASTESAGKSKAQNSRSTAGGLFQVIDETWKRYGGAPGKKFDVDENIRIGTDILADNSARLEKKFGRAPSGAELYAAHFFGPEKGVQIMSAPADTPLNAFLSKKVFKANPNLKDKTAGDIATQFNTRFAAKPAAAPAVVPAAVPVRPEPVPENKLLKYAEAAPASERAVVAENKYIESRPDVVAQAREYGPGYQAALALAALDEDDDDEEYTTKSGEPLMREKSAAQQFLETETPPQGLAGVDFKVKSPFPETAGAPGTVALLAKGGIAKEGKQKPAGNAKSQLLQMKTQLGLQGAAVDDRLQGLGSANTALGSPAFTRRGDLSQDTMGVAHFAWGGQAAAFGNYYNPTTKKYTDTPPTMANPDYTTATYYEQDPSGKYVTSKDPYKAAGPVYSYTPAVEGTSGYWNDDDYIPGTEGTPESYNAVAKPAATWNQAKIIDPNSGYASVTGGTPVTPGSTTLPNWRKTTPPAKDAVLVPTNRSGINTPVVRDNPYTLPAAPAKPNPWEPGGEIRIPEDPMPALPAKGAVSVPTNRAGINAPVVRDNPYTMPKDTPVQAMLPKRPPPAKMPPPFSQPMPTPIVDTGLTPNKQFMAEGGSVAGDAASMLEKLKGYGETAASIGSGVLSSIPAGYAGLKELAVSRDPARAAQEVQRVQEAGTYVPRGTSGKESLSKAAEMLELLNVPAQKVGEAAFRASGNSPLVGAAAETVLDPLNFVPGAKAIKGFPKAVKEAAFAAYGAGPTGTASHVIRPVGGSFPSAKSVEEFPVSHLDDFILNSVEKIQQRYPEGPARKTLEDMFDKKARDYFRTTAGSIADPLREMFLENKLPAQEKTPLGETIPSYLREAARKGNPQAMQALEQEYGKLLNMQVTRRSPDLESAKASTSQDILKQMQEQPQLIPDATLVSLMRDPTALSKKEVKEYATKIRQRMKDNPEFFSAVLERKAEYLPTKTESYTEGFKSREEMQPYANIYPPVMTAKDLPAHLQHEVDTAIEKQQPIMDLKGHYKALGLDTEDYLKAADSISAKDLSQMSFPDFVAKAYNLNAQTATIKNLATTAQKLITEKKPFPKEIKDFGVKEVAQAPDGYRWVQVTNPDATIIQGKLMDNSIAGYSRSGTYGPLKTGRQGITDGKLNVFVLQDPKGYPVVNADYIPGLQELHQMTGNGTGTGNAIPVLYSDKIQSLFDALEKRGDYVKTMPTSIENLMLGLD